MTPTPIPVTLTVPSSVSFASEGGVKEAAVSSNATWSVSDDSTWISCSKKSNYVLVVSAEKNESTSARTGSITVKSGNIIKTITVTQTKLNVQYFDVSPKEIYYKDSARTLVIQGSNFIMTQDPIIYIEYASTKKRIDIPKSNITKSSKIIKVELPVTVKELGYYNLHIEYNNNTSKKFDNAFKLTDNANLSPTSNNLSTLKTGLLTIEGAVKEIEKDSRYEVSGTVTINKYIKYDGSALEVDVKNGLVSGNGSVYIPVNNPKYIGNKITLFKGFFQINSKDTVFHSKKNDTMELLETFDSDLKFEGLPISIESIKIIDGGVDISGAIQFSNILPSSAVKKVGKVKFEAGFESLKITCDGISLKSEFSFKGEVPIGLLTLKEATVKIDTEEKGWGVKVTVDIASFLEDVSAEIGVKDGKFDTILFKTGLPKPIPICSTGFGVTALGGGVSNLSKGGADTLIVLMADIEDLISPEIDGKHLINFDDIELKFSLKSASIEGKFSIYCYEVASGSTSISKDEGFKSEFEIDLLGVYYAEGLLEAAPGKGLTGSMTGTLQIPHEVPVIGGAKLKESKAILTSDYIKASDEVLFVKVVVKFTFNPKHLYVNDWKIFSTDNVDNSLHKKETESGSYEIGTNLKYLGSKTVPANNGFSPFSMNTYDINIQNNPESIVILYTWQDEMPNIKVTKPDGSEYKLCNDKESTDYNYTYLFDEKKGSIKIVAPSNGVWKFEYDKAGLTFNTFDMLLNAQIDKFEVFDMGNNKLKFTWVAQNTDKACIGMNQTRGELVGTLLADNLSASGEIIIDIPEDMLSGKYYFYLLADRFDAAPDYKYAETVLDYTDLLKPSKPDNFTVNSISNGEVSLFWDKSVSESDYNGYYIVDNNNDKPVYLMHVASTENNAIVTGLEFEKNYSLGVIAYTTKDSASYSLYHYSDISNIVSVKINKPNPPEIKFNISAIDGKMTDKVIDNDKGLVHHYINSDKAKLDVSIDKPGITEIFINDKLINSYNKASIEETVTLYSGENNIQVIAKGENSDQSEFYYSIYSDNVSPMLIIDSPIHGDVINDKTVLVKGRGEYGSSLMINGIAVSMNGEGYFSQSISLDSVVNRINAVITDVSGNYSIYEADVIKELNEINTVSIDLEETTLVVGKQKPIRLIMEESDGSKTEAPIQSINWKVLEGTNNVKIDNGYIMPLRPGKVVLKATFCTSDSLYMESEPINITVVNDIITVTPSPIPSPIETPSKKTEKGSGGGRIMPVTENTPTPTPTSTPTPTPTPESVPNTPIDIEGHWAEQYINSLVGKKIISGYEDNTYRPENLITRAEAAVLIVKMLGLDISENKNLDFDDNSTIPDWAVGYIKTAVDKGIIRGYEDNTFKASNQITRAEISVMVIKALEENQTAGDKLSFLDSDQIEIWAKGYIEKAYSLKIISGYPDNTIQSSKKVTRAETAVILSKALEYLKSKI